MSAKDREVGTKESTDNSKKKKKRKDRRIEREYEDTIEVMDPVTGKPIRQKVKIKVYKPKGDIRKMRQTVSENDLGYEEGSED